MCIASFLLYALGVLTLHQDLAPGWAVEALGPIPSAVSYLVYGTPLGGLDSNVFATFLRATGITVQDLLAKSSTGSIPHGMVELYSSDGNGALPNLFCTIAMWMFGMQLSSLTLFYLLFVGISVFAFTFRYQDRRLLAVPLYFLVVTGMLLTPLCTSPLGIEQNPIGGIRYFSLATFLPALHSFFEFIERSDETTKNQIANSLALLTQGVLLFGALLMRSSAGYLLGLFFLILVWRFYKERRQRDQLLALGRKSAVVCAAIVFWITVILTALPVYEQTGRLFSVFWHRAFVGLSLHPDWPFGDLRNAYDCTQYIPQGLSRIHMDQNGHCAWLALNKNLSVGQINQEIFGREYEMSLREAYFHVITHYPKQVFELYFFIKSRLIKDTLTQAWRFLFDLQNAPVAKGLFVIAAAQLALLIVFVISLMVADLNLMHPGMMIFPVMFVGSLPPLYFAWSLQTTAMDTIFLMYSCLVLAVLFVVQSFMKIICLRRAAVPGGLPERSCVRRPRPQNET
jgi:hypothetical protein